MHSFEKCEYEKLVMLSLYMPMDLFKHPWIYIPGAKTWWEFRSIYVVLF